MRRPRLPKVRWRTLWEPEFDSYGRRRRILHPPELKEKLVAQQNGLCHWCKRPFNIIPEGERDVRPSSWTATFEHVEKFANGGLDAEHNLVADHGKCNHDRDKKPNKLKVRYKDKSNATKPDPAT